MPAKRQASPQQPSRQALPSWAANLVGFSLLIAIVLMVFFWQLTGIQNTLQRNALNRSTMVLSIIEENLSNAAMASATINATVTSFLRDKARFVAYLDSIDPLLPGELEALARETGLHSIILVRPSGTVLNRQTWSESVNSCQAGDRPITYLHQVNIGFLTYIAPDNSDIGCITIALDATPILALQQKTALPVLLQTLSALPGLRYVRLEPHPVNPPEDQAVKLLQDRDKYTAEARMPTDQGLLVVGLNASNYIKRREQLRSQFLLFAALLLGMGLFFSWLLYRYQRADLEQTRRYERNLARQHEAAALGRATATIAHEIRNPLNAIHLGLQRLQYESQNLDSEQEELIAAMGQAVKRTGLIISELQRFTRPLQPERTPLRLSGVIDQQLALYKHLCESRQLSITTDFAEEDTIQADTNLLSELVENLLKNSIEAQPDTGFITLRTLRRDSTVELECSNGGFSLARESVAKLGEPYFTTKTRGTGLGLALCRRIAEAHGGSLQINADQQQQTLTVRVRLPVNAPGPQTDNGATAA